MKAENFAARNLSMLMDFYELTMANGYFESGEKDTIAVFDMFFRNIPDRGGFAIFAGLEQLIGYMQNLRFDEEDIAYLRGRGMFSEEFLQYLANFQFSCDVWAVPEGTPVFPNEPLVVVRGPVIQAQLLETMLLLTLNHQSLIATKANRIARAARGRAVMEFGSRRAQGFDGAIYGARAAFIGGCSSTACTISDMLFGVPAVGTMAHSWVLTFDSEYEAFKTYAEIYPGNCTLLVDTYNVLKSGMPNAIRVFDEVVVPRGFRPKGVRIDSGDIAYLSKRMRKMLDDAGYQDVAIVASNSLDEYIINELWDQGAQVDQFGVGESLITSRSNPVFGGVYKIAATVKNGEYEAKIKVSESIEKITTPCFKTLYRLYEKDTGKAIADYVALFDEEIDESQPLTIFDPIATWKKQELTGYTAQKLLCPIFEQGRLVYQCPELRQVQDYCRQQVDTLWDEMKRFEFPHRYYVDLSDRLWTVKRELLDQVPQ